MLSIAKLARAEYYLENQLSGGDGSYYVGGKEPDGTWLNPGGLFELSDGAAVESEIFSELYHGYDPDGQALTRNSGKATRCPGFDLTFSADKSVSVLWALSDAATRARIDLAVQAAARDALDHTILAHASSTRVQVAGVQQPVDAELLGAQFLHHESRELDPQLHVHTTIFNVAVAADGKPRALLAPPIFAWKMAAGAAFRVALAVRLTRELGVTLDRYDEKAGYARVRGIPSELVAQFSKRRAMIKDAADAIGANPGHAAAMAKLTIATRGAKSESGDLEEDIARWQVEANAALDRAQIEPGAAHDCTRIPEACMAAAAAVTAGEGVERRDKLSARLAGVLTQLTAHKAVFSRTELTAAVYQATVGVASLKAADAAIEKLLASHEVVRTERGRASLEAEAGMAHAELFTTRTQLAREVSVRGLSRVLAADGVPAASAAEVDAHLAAVRAAGQPLSDEQAAAVTHAATARSQVIAIEGAAGSGKSTVLAPLADIFRRDGGQVIAAATAWQTAAALGDDIGEKDMGVAVDALISQVEKKTRVIAAGTTIVVDEAGLLDVAQMQRLLTFSRAASARVVLVGDRAQQQPVGAGSGLVLVRKEIDGVQIETIQRQRATSEDMLRHLGRAGGEDDAIRLAGQLDPAETAALQAAFEADPDHHTAERWQVRATEAARDGRAGETLAAYDRRGGVQLHDTAEAQLDAVAAEWCDWREANPGQRHTFVAKSRAEVLAVSLRIREHAFWRMFRTASAWWSRSRTAIGTARSTWSWRRATGSACGRR